MIGVTKTRKMFRTEVVMKSNDVLVLKNNEYVLSPQALDDLREFSEQLKRLNDLDKALRTQIKEEMERKNIIEIKTDDVTIKYIAGTSRETFDSKKLREDNPDLYDLYVKISNVSPSVRITLTGDKK